MQERERNRRRNEGRELIATDFLRAPYLTEATPFLLPRTLLPRPTLNKGFMASEAPVLTVAIAIAALCDELSLAHRAAHLPLTGPVDTEPALACST